MTTCEPIEWCGRCTFCGRPICNCPGPMCACETEDQA